MITEQEPFLCLVDYEDSLASDPSLCSPGLDSCRTGTRIQAGWAASGLFPSEPGPLLLLRALPSLAWRLPWRERPPAHWVVGGQAAQELVLTPCLPVCCHSVQLWGSCHKPFSCPCSLAPGTAIITEDHAAMWTDGRYFLQAAKQMDSNWTLMKMGA